MYDIVIIDPSSVEFNRGSFCYLPYILYSYLKSVRYNVLLLEDFNCSSIDDIPEADNYLIGFWSYPQIEACLVLNRFMKKTPKFFGYIPLIEKYFGKEKVFHRSFLDKIIEAGIKNYPLYFEDFRFLLLSDCDMHLKKYSGRVYPLFTSYGCINNCSFCPVSINCSRKRVSLPPEVILKELAYCSTKGYKNIHFTDEDFFYDIDRAYNILSNLGKNDMKFISLGSISKVLSFIEKYGQRVLEDSGMKLIEVGFETGSDELAKAMRKPSSEVYEKLACICTSVDIFWLTLTFFPGETINTLNDTGDFLRQYGFRFEDLYGRIVTNSTHGGLGQFFQLYEGVKDFDLLKNSGEFLSSRPIRLIPSFIPYSFLDSIIKEIREINKEEYKWYELYGINPEQEDLFIEGRTIRDLVDKRGKLSMVERANLYIYFAISARLGVIR